MVTAGRANDKRKCAMLCDAISRVSRIAFNDRFFIGHNVMRDWRVFV
jgi:hypothetical protein